MQWRHERPTKYLRSFRFNLNQWAGWNYGGDLLSSGGNVNAHAVFANNWSTGVGVNVNAQGFDDRATRGGPGAYDNGQRSIWGYLTSDNRRALSANVFVFRGNDQHGSHSADYSPSLDWRPSSFLLISGGLHIGTNHDESQWIEQSGTHYVFGAARSEDGRVDDPRQLHGDADAVDSALRRAVRLGRRLLELQGARRRPFAVLRRALSSLRVRRRTPTSITARSGPRMCCAGNTRLARRCSWCGSRDARTRSTSAGSASIATSAASSTRPATNVFLVKLAYWLNY